MKRAKLNLDPAPAPSWLDLEPGIWEAVFQKLTKPADKRSLRLSCKLFKDSASRTIKNLELKRMGCKEDDTLTNVAIEELPGSLAYIESLTCYSYMWMEKDAFPLTRFAQLKQLNLDFQGSRLPSDILPVFGSIKTLRALILKDFSIEDNMDSRALSQLDKLENLEITRWAPWKDRPVFMSALKDLTSLTHLKMTKPFTFCDRGYHHLSSLSQLKSLQLGYSWLLGTDCESLGFVSSLSQLTKISITKSFVDDTGLQPLNSLPNLQLLGICHCNRVKGTVFKHLTSLSKLHGLTLEGSNQLTDEGVYGIATLTTLQQLHLGSSSFISLEACTQALPALANLMRLRLPRGILAQWPAPQVVAAFPNLKSYIAAPFLQRMDPGLIEDNLQRWALLQPELLESGRCQILDWFHEHKG